MLHESYWQIKFRNPAPAEAEQTINSLNWQPKLTKHLHIHNENNTRESVKESGDGGYWDS